MYRPAILFSCVAMLSLSGTVSYALPPSSQQTSMTQAPSIERFVHIDNQVLTKVNDKFISVLDVANELERVFDSEFKEYKDIPEARYEFYSAHWRQFFQDMVDRQLVIADADEQELPLTEGEIRLQIEQMYGPDVVGNLDRAGLSMEEAREQIIDDMKMGRMMYIRVHSKAMGTISPKLIRETYTKYSKTVKEPESWSYKVLTLRSEDDETLATSAKELFSLLNEGTLEIESLEEYLQDNTKESVTVNISDLYERTEQDISASHRDILTNMKAQEFSSPNLQLSKRTKESTYRIFYLESHQEAELATLEELEPRVIQKIRSETSIKKTNEYLSRLHEHFDCDPEKILSQLGSNYQPFNLI
ncbi:MAG: hypothetical protein CMO81_07475 [Waddliaceae bacterium]|nr:hypothetical protein [Waddliaceae bacterium]